jgi:hypothetical protein
LSGVRQRFDGRRVFTGRSEDLFRIPALAFDHGRARPVVTEWRVVFDFAIEFANGGGLQGQDFRLDIEGKEISDEDLADYLVEDLRLLMVSKVEISNKRYIEEAHKRLVDEA